MEIKGHNVEVELHRRKEVIQEKGPQAIPMRFEQLKDDEKKVLDYALNRKGLGVDQVITFPFEDISQEERNHMYSLLGDFLFHTDTTTRENIAKEFAQAMAKLYN
jgi:hypothetical protein